MSNDRDVTFGKWFTVGLLIASVTLGLSWLALWDYYVSNKPREKQVSQGRVIPLVSHGIVVYLTIEEGKRLTLLNYAGNVLGVSFVIVYLWKKPFGSPR